MRRLLINIFFFISVLGSAQVFKAGDALLYYQDIAPDTLLDYVIGASGGPMESYYFDVNGDLQNDISISAYINSGGAGGSEFIEVSAGANAYIKFGRKDSVYNNFYSTWWFTNVADTLSNGDTINPAGAGWRTGTLDLTDQSYLTGAYKNVQDWVSASDLYLGIKYADSFDTIYGWIRVNCPAKNKCYVKDYAYSKAPNGVQNYSQPSLSIWPNPAHEFFRIEGVAEAEISITDITGHVVLQTSCKTKPAQIPAGHWPAGIYFVQIRTRTGTSAKKILIQH